MKKSLLRTNKELTEIYERNVDMVYRISFSYLRNRSDAEDVVQDTFAKLFEYKKTFQSQEHEKAWLIVTTSNICKNKLKHWWNKIVRFEDYQTKYNDVGFETDESLIVVMGLPTKYKIVVYLYYYECYTSTQIATMLHKPNSTIRNYLSEARKILKEKLGGDFDE